MKTTINRDTIVDKEFHLQTYYTDYNSVKYHSDNRIVRGGRVDRLGVLLPSYRPQFKPVLKGVAFLTAFAFTFTTLIPAGWAGPEPVPNHLKVLQGYESSEVEAGLEEALWDSTVEDSPVRPEPVEGRTGGDSPSRNFWQMRAGLSTEPPIAATGLEEVPTKPPTPSRVGQFFKRTVPAAAIVGATLAAPKGLPQDAPAVGVPLAEPVAQKTVPVEEAKPLRALVAEPAGPVPAGARVGEADIGFASMEIPPDRSQVIQADQIPARLLGVIPYESSEPKSEGALLMSVKVEKTSQGWVATVTPPKMRRTLVPPTEIRQPLSQQVVETWVRGFHAASNAIPRGEISWALPDIGDRESSVFIWSPWQLEWLPPHHRKALLEGLGKGRVDILYGINGAIQGEGYASYDGGMKQVAKEVSRHLRGFRQAGVPRTHPLLAPPAWLINGGWKEWLRQMEDVWIHYPGFSGLTYLDFEVWTDPEWEKPPEKRNANLLRAKVRKWYENHLEALDRLKDAGAPERLPVFVPPAHHPFHQLLAQVLQGQNVSFDPRIGVAVMAYVPFSEIPAAVNGVSDALGVPVEMVVNLMPMPDKPSETLYDEFAADPRKAEADLKEAISKTSCRRVIFHVATVQELLDLGTPQRVGSLYPSWVPQGIQRGMDRAFWKVRRDVVENLPGAYKYLIGDPAQRPLRQRFLVLTPKEPGQELSETFAGMGQGILTGTVPWAIHHRGFEMWTDALYGRPAYKPDSTPTQVEGIYLGPTKQALDFFMGYVGHPEIVKVEILPVQGKETKPLTGDVRGVGGGLYLASAADQTKVFLRMTVTRDPNPVRVFGIELPGFVRQLVGHSLTMALRTGQTHPGSLAEREAWFKIQIPSGEVQTVTDIPLHPLVNGGNRYTIRIFDGRNQVAEMEGAGQPGGVVAEGWPYLVTQAQERLERHLAELGRDPWKDLSVEEIRKQGRMDLAKAKRISSARELGIRMGGAIPLVVRMEATDGDDPVQLEKALQTLRTVANRALLLRVPDLEKQILDLVHASDVGILTGTSFLERHPQVVQRIQAVARLAARYGMEVYLQLEADALKELAKSAPLQTREKNAQERGAVLDTLSETLHLIGDLLEYRGLGLQGFALYDPQADPQLRQRVEQVVADRLVAPLIVFGPPANAVDRVTSQKSLYVSSVGLAVPSTVLAELGRLQQAPGPFRPPLNHSWSRAAVLGNSLADAVAWVKAQPTVQTDPRLKRILFERIRVPSHQELSQQGLSNEEISEAQTYAATVGQGDFNRALKDPNHLDHAKALFLRDVWAANLDDLSDRTQQVRFLTDVEDYLLTEVGRTRSLPLIYAGFGHSITQRAVPSHQVIVKGEPIPIVVNLTHQTHPGRDDTGLYRVRFVGYHRPANLRIEWTQVVPLKRGETTQLAVPIEGLPLGTFTYQVSAVSAAIESIREGIPSSLLPWERELSWDGGTVEIMDSQELAQKRLGEVIPHLLAAEWSDFQRQMQSIQTLRALGMGVSPDRVPPLPSEWLEQELRNRYGLFCDFQRTRTEGLPGHWVKVPVLKPDFPSLLQAELKRILAVQENLEPPEEEPMEYTTPQPPLKGELANKNFWTLMPLLILQIVGSLFLGGFWYRWKLWREDARYGARSRSGLLPPSERRLLSPSPKPQGTTTTTPPSSVGLEESIPGKDLQRLSLRDENVVAVGVDGFIPRPTEVKPSKLDRLAGVVAVDPRLVTPGWSLVNKTMTIQSATEMAQRILGDLKAQSIDLKNPQKIADFLKGYSHFAEIGSISPSALDEIASYFQENRRTILGKDQKKAVSAIEEMVLAQLPPNDREELGLFIQEKIGENLTQRRRGSIEIRGIPKKTSFTTGSYSSWWNELQQAISAIDPNAASELPDTDLKLLPSQWPPLTIPLSLDVSPEEWMKVKHLRRVLGKAFVRLDESAGEPQLLVDTRMFKVSKTNQAGEIAQFFQRLYVDSAIRVTPHRRQGRWIHLDDMAETYGRLKRELRRAIMAPPIHMDWRFWTWTARAYGWENPTTKEKIGGLLEEIQIRRGKGESLWKIFWEHFKRHPLSAIPMWVVRFGLEKRDRTATEPVRWSFPHVITIWAFWGALAIPFLVVGSACLPYVLPIAAFAIFHRLFQLLPSEWRAARWATAIVGLLAIPLSLLGAAPLAGVIGGTGLISAIGAVASGTAGSAAWACLGTFTFLGGRLTALAAFYALKAVELAVILPLAIPVALMRMIEWWDRIQGRPIKRWHGDWLAPISDKFIEILKDLQVPVTVFFQVLTYTGSAIVRNFLEWIAGDPNVEHPAALGAALTIAFIVGAVCLFPWGATVLGLLLASAFLIQPTLAFWNRDWGRLKNLRWLVPAGVGLALLFFPPLSVFIASHPWWIIGGVFVGFHLLPALFMSGILSAMGAGWNVAWLFQKKQLLKGDELVKRKERFLEKEGRWLNRIDDQFRRFQGLTDTILVIRDSTGQEKTLSEPEVHLKEALAQRGRWYLGHIIVMLFQLLYYRLAMSMRRWAGDILFKAEEFPDTVERRLASQDRSSIVAILWRLIPDPVREWWTGMLAGPPIVRVVPLDPQDDKDKVIMEQMGQDVPRDLKGADGRFSTYLKFPKVAINLPYAVKASTADKEGIVTIRLEPEITPMRLVLRGEPPRLPKGAFLAAIRDFSYRKGRLNLSAKLEEDGLYLTFPEGEEQYRLFTEEEVPEVQDIRTALQAVRARKGDQAKILLEALTPPTHRLGRNPHRRRTAQEWFWRRLSGGVAPQILGGTIPAAPFGRLQYRESLLNTEEPSDKRISLGSGSSTAGLEEIQRIGKYAVDLLVPLKEHPLAKTFLFTTAKGEANPQSELIHGPERSTWAEPFYDRLAELNQDRSLAERSKSWGMIAKDFGQAPFPLTERAAEVTRKLFGLNAMSDEDLYGHFGAIVERRYQEDLKAGRTNLPLEQYLRHQSPLHQDTDTLYEMLLDPKADLGAKWAPDFADLHKKGNNDSLVTRLTRLRQRVKDSTQTFDQLSPEEQKALKHETRKAMRKTKGFSGMFRKGMLYLYNVRSVPHRILAGFVAGVGVGLAASFFWTPLVGVAAGAAACALTFGLTQQSGWARGWLVAGAVTAAVAGLTTTGALTLPALVALAGTMAKVCLIAGAAGALLYGVLSGRKDRGLFKTMGRVFIVFGLAVTATVFTLSNPILVWNLFYTALFGLAAGIWAAYANQAVPSLQMVGGRNWMVMGSAAFFLTWWAAASFLLAVGAGLLTALLFRGLHALDTPYSGDVRILSNLLGVSPHQFDGFWDSSSWKLRIKVPAVLEGVIAFAIPLLTRGGAIPADAKPLSMLEALVTLEIPVKKARISLHNLLLWWMAEILQEAETKAEDTKGGEVAVEDLRKGRRGGARPPLMPVPPASLDATQDLLQLPGELRPWDEAINRAAEEALGSGSKEAEEHLFKEFPLLTEDGSLHRGALLLTDGQVRSLTVTEIEPPRSEADGSSVVRYQFKVVLDSRDGESSKKLTLVVDHDAQVVGRDYGGATLATPFTVLQNLWGLKPFEIQQLFFGPLEQGVPNISNQIFAHTATNLNLGTVPGTFMPGFSHAREVATMLDPNFVVQGKQAMEDEFLRLARLLAHAKNQGLREIEEEDQRLSLLTLGEIQDRLKSTSNPLERPTLLRMEELRNALNHWGRARQVLSRLPKIVDDLKRQGKDEGVDPHLALAVALAGVDENASSKDSSPAVPPAPRLEKKREDLEERIRQAEVPRESEETPGTGLEEAPLRGTFLYKNVEEAAVVARVSEAWAGQAEQVSEIPAGIQMSDASGPELSGVVQWLRLASVVRADDNDPTAPRQLELAMNAALSLLQIQEEAKRKAIEVLAAVFQRMQTASLLASQVNLRFENPETVPFVVPVAKTGLVKVSVLTETIAEAQGLRLLFEAAGVSADSYAIESVQACGENREEALLKLKKHFPDLVSYPVLATSLGGILEFLNRFGIFIDWEAAVGLEEKVGNYLGSLA